MKILKRKNRRKAVRKWSGYFVAAYVIASWGVNGIVNPIHYLRQTVMQEQTVRFVEETHGWALEKPQNGEGMNYLSFQVKDAKTYAAKVQLLVYAKTGEARTIYVKLWRGLNSIDLQLWEKVVVPQTQVASTGIVLEDVVLSEYRQVDTGRMVSVMASFLLLLAFWEGVWWMKGRYDQTVTRRDK